MLRTLLAALLGGILAVTVGTAPASAHGLNVHPMTPTNKVVIQAPDNAWGIRPAVADFAQRTGGVGFHRAKGVKCSDYPNAQCIRVHVGNYGTGSFGACEETTIVGCAQIGGTDPTIWLNNYYFTGGRDGGRKSDTACHEFMHAMGLYHHHHQGCVSEWDNRSTATWVEINRLAREYTWLTTNDPDKDY